MLYDHSLFLFLILLLSLLLLLRLRFLLYFQQSSSCQFHIADQRVDDLLFGHRSHKGLLVLVEVGGQVVGLDAASCLSFFHTAGH
jgi:hypothetical protein